MAALRALQRLTHPRSLLSRAVGTSSLADDLLHNMHQKSTWDRFYMENQTSAFRHFDWFFGYKHVAGFLQSFLQSKGGTQTWQVLDMGCGTSDLGLGLYRDSPDPVHVSCVDFSPVAIRSMQDHFAAGIHTPLNPGSQLHFRVADATDLAHVGTHTFHLVLDKGTSDALLRSTEGAGKASRMVAECLRVLRPGGSLLQFSDEDPDARIPFLEQTYTSEGVRVDAVVHDLGTVGGISYYAYILTAPPGAGRREVL